MTVEASESQIDTFKQEGNQFFSSGDYPKAVAAYNKAIKADPSNGVLYSNRAAAFIHLGKEVKAIKDAEQAIELKPDWAKGYFRKGTALVNLRRWDEAITVLRRAAELESASKEINQMLREAQRKRSAEKGEKKREEGKGLKLVGGGGGKETKATSGGGSSSATISSSTSAPKLSPGPAPLGISDAGMEKFVQSSLTAAVTQFAEKGELKSIVYLQPHDEKESLQMVGIVNGFDSPQANDQCCQFLREHAEKSQSVAVMVLAEKRNIAYPQVWKEKTVAQWQWKSNEQGIFMQLDYRSDKKDVRTAERKMWFIPTGAGKDQSPKEPVELSVDDFQIMPPLLR